MPSFFRSLPMLSAAVAVIAVTSALSAPAFAQQATPTAKTVAAAEKKSDNAALGKGEENVENYDLPAYGPNDLVAIGQMESMGINEADTLLDVARALQYGYVEIRAANPGVDPWTPVPGQQIVLPSFELMPRATQKGIVVNLGAMRLYHFYEQGKAPRAYPIGIGREGLQTPTGKTTIVRKAENPTWSPTKRMRDEKPWLPVTVPAGAANPLGAHALYLGWPTFLIHGTNKPWGIGRRLSSGCMRMYPEDVQKLYGAVPTGTPVTIVDQPVLVGWVGDTLYLEAHPTRHQSYQIESSEPMTTDAVLRDDLRALIVKTAGERAKDINWGTVDETLTKRLGYPIPIIGGAPAPASEEKTVAAEPVAAKKPAPKAKAKPKKPQPEPRTQNRHLFNP